eukprot:80166_1
MQINDYSCHLKQQNRHHLAKLVKLAQLQKMHMQKKYGLSPDKCIQGGATTDEELCEFLQQNISIPDIECLVVISSKPANAYRLPTEEATVTGMQILGQMVLANKTSLRVFH